MKQKVLVWIYDDSGHAPRFLLLQTNKKRGEFWQPITGSVEAGEEYPDAALREANEETGLEIEMTALQDLKFSFKYKGRRGPTEEYAFAAEVDSEDSVTLDPQEHITYRWVSAAKAKERCLHSSNVEALERLETLLDR